MAHERRTRRADSFRRRPGRRTPRPITLIVCEGDTERVYFEAVRASLGLSTAEVVIPDAASRSAPINVVNAAAAKAKERGGYDYICCVFDRDRHESFDRARRKLQDLARRWTVREAVSIPCFEVWILLHHERTDAPFTQCDDVITRIRQHLPHYTKADAEIARGLINRITDALDNAHWLESRRATTGDNPSTSIHHLMQHLQALADN